MSRKTSTAALDPFRQKPLRNPRRVPRRPAGEEPANRKRGHLSNLAKRAHPVMPNGLCGVRAAAPSRALRAMNPSLLDQTSQAELVIPEEHRMHGRNPQSQPRSLRTILPVILRIAFHLFLWTLGARMNIAAAQPNERCASGHRFSRAVAKPLRL